MRLWLGLSEDWSNAEAIATACAASGTLATAASDNGVAIAMLQENCAQSLLSLLESERVDLVHRAVVVIMELVSGEERNKLAKYLVEAGIVPALGVVAKMNNEMLTDLVRSTAQALSAVMKDKI